MDSTVQSNSQEKPRVRRVTQGAEEVKAFMRNFYKRAGEVKDRGGKVAWVMRGITEELLYAMDIFPVYPENYGTVCASRGVAPYFMEPAEADGFCSDLCSYLRNALGYAIKMREAGGEILTETPLGGMPKPDMLLAPSRTCDARAKIFQAVRRYLDVPCYIYDWQTPPLDDPRCRDEETSRRYIDYHVEQLKGLVTFLERQTGKKLDMDRLRESVKNSIEVWKYFYNIYELRKAVPCPMGSEDLFAINFPYLFMAGEKVTVDFYRRLYEEVSMRVRNKMGVVPTENYRLMWVGLPVWFDMGIFNYLETFQAVSVIETNYYPGQPSKIDVSNPLEALAKKAYWGYEMGGADGSEIRCGVVGGNLVLKLAREYNVDGVILHSTTSCRASSIGLKNMSRIVRERLNLPSLYLQSDMADISYYAPEQFKTRISSFMESLAQGKG